MTTKSISVSFSRNVRLREVEAVLVDIVRVLRVVGEPQTVVVGHSGTRLELFIRHLQLPFHFDVGAQKVTWQNTDDYQNIGLWTAKIMMCALAESLCGELHVGGTIRAVRLCDATDYVEDNKIRATLDPMSLLAFWTQHAPDVIPEQRSL